MQIQLLYRQRLCSTLLRLIVSASKAGDGKQNARFTVHFPTSQLTSLSLLAESAAEANRLIALSVLLRNMPKQMVLTELPKVRSLEV